MNQFMLEKDEFELFKGKAKLIVDKKELETDVHLTTKHVAFTITTRVLLSKKTETEIHEISKVKIYNEKPQIKIQKDTVDIYFEDCERVLKFVVKKEAQKFVDEAVKFLTGKSKFVRIVETTKGVINEVDETLNINSVGIAKTVVGFSGKKIAGVLARKKVSSNQETLRIEGGGIFKKKETKSLALTPDEQIEAVKKLKVLLDEGAITEEEYEKKKREVMGL